MKKYELTLKSVLSAHYCSATPIVIDWRAEQYLLEGKN